MPRLHSDAAPTVQNPTSKPLFWMVLVTWAIPSVGGFLWMLSYAATPGSSGTLEPTWPNDSRIVPDAARANLVVLMHPHCPCSRASLSELAEIMTRCEGLVTTHVLFLTPSHKPDGWEVSDLWHQAKLIPGVRVLADEEGSEARLFGAQTSGHAALNDPQGRLMFRGGITIARGHSGDNDGRRIIIDRLTGTPGLTTESFVFGCPLFDGCPQVRRPDPADFWAP